MKSKTGFLCSRKAQMTVFVIIGILILFTFVALQMLTRQTAQIQLRESTQKLIADLLKSGALPYYVNTCLDRSLKEGLLLAGQQGGNIYNFQDGPVGLPSKYLPMSGMLNGQPITTQVAYVISMPGLQNGTVYPFPPGYPGGVGKSQQVPKLEWKNFGRFGEVSLRRLCDVNGANKPFAVGKSVGFTPICLNNMYADVESTQWQLEQFIRKRLHACVNWSAIAQETAYNVTSLDLPNVTFRLGDIDVWVDAFYPIRVRVGGREPVTTVADFHVREPVRLKHVVEIASFMSIYDSYSLNWNLSRHTMELPFWDSFMSLKLFKYPLPGVWHDVVEITDDASQIDGQPYVFRFVRENRYPALDYIHQVSENQTYDLVTLENNTVWIMPNPDWSKIYDPDEDNLTYEYTGWKETCDEPFDFVTGLNVYDCSNRVESPLLLKFQPQEKRLPRNWTNSQPYKISQRNASISTNHSDIGPHNVTVWVCDEEGLCDYQVVKIMVYDIPELQFNTTSPYNDTNWSSASVEDPFRLDASGTTTYFSPLITYVFTDKTEPFEVFTKHPFTIYELPGTTYNISTIVDLNFSKVALGTEKNKQHKIEFTVSPALPPPLIREITVYQCLPHRNAESPPWPYNTIDDPFDADHTCCSNGTGEFGTDPKLYPWGSYLPSTAVCYTAMPLLGVYSSFKDEASVGGLVTNTVIHDGGATLAPVEGVMKNYGNDVFVRTFERACSEDRGNTCTGVGTDARRVLQKCSPDKAEGDVEFCSGPNIGFPKTSKPMTLTGKAPCAAPGIEVNGKCYGTSASTACVQYATGDSFEKYFGLIGPEGKPTRSDGKPATGICNEGPRCTDGVEYVHGKGNKLSNAQCSGTDKGCSHVNVVDDCDAKFSDCQTKPDDTNHYFVYRAKCEVSAEGVGSCNTVAKDASLITGVDDDKDACAKCMLQGKTGKGLKLPGDKSSCCGDDKGEGGFPYKRVINPGGFFVGQNFLTGAPFSLTYSKNVENDCDDAWSTGAGTDETAKKVQTYWIDNDCDGNANCVDTDCKGQSGPSGGRCCSTTPDSCPSSSFLPGSVCDAALKECDCKASGTSFAAPDAIITALGTRTGCIASVDEALLNQKMLRFAGLAGTRTFNVIFTPYVQGSTCGGSTIQIHGPGATYTLLNKGTSFSTDVGADFFVAFKAGSDKDCKYTLTVT